MRTYLRKATSKTMYALLSWRLTMKYRPSAVKAPPSGSTSKLTESPDGP